MQLTREMYQSLAWTAHGIKMWDKTLFSLDYVERDGKVLQAMSELEDLIGINRVMTLAETLAEIPVTLYDNSLGVTRNVKRIPLKAEGKTRREREHNDQSYDGLKTFHPYTIHNFNVSSLRGCLEAIRACQDLDGFGRRVSSRPRQYSILLVDIAIYWQIWRMAYSFTGMVPIRHDLFLVLGLWHTFAHSHRLAWSEFRSTFLACAFFCLFPNETLLFEPKLKQSVTFFLWLRLSYVGFRLELTAAISKYKALVIQMQRKIINSFDEVTEELIFEYERYIGIHEKSLVVVVQSMYI